jgi:hypothetical protein
MDRPEMFEKFIDALSSSDLSGKLKVMLLKKGIDMIQSAECLQYLQRLDDLDMMCILNVSEEKEKRCQRSMISNIRFENLSANTNTILMLIIDRCVQKRTPNCTYSMIALQNRTKYSQGRIHSSIKMLEDLGYISISRVPMEANRYYLDGESVGIYLDEIKKNSSSTRF